MLILFQVTTPIQMNGKHSISDPELAPAPVPVLPEPTLLVGTHQQTEAYQAPSPIQLAMSVASLPDGKWFCVSQGKEPGVYASWYVYPYSTTRVYLTIYCLCQGRDIPTGYRHVSRRLFQV